MLKEKKNLLQAIFGHPEQAIRQNLFHQYFLPVEKKCKKGRIWIWPLVYCLRLSLKQRYNYPWKNIIKMNQ